MDTKKTNAGVTEACLVLISLIGVMYVLSCASRIMIPFAFAFILSMLFYPIIRFGTKHKVSAKIMAVAVMICLIAVLVPMGLFINSRLQGVAAYLPDYYTKLVGIGKTILERFEISHGFWDDSSNWLNTNTILPYISNMTGFLLVRLSTLTMMMVFLFFMLLESTTAENRMRRAFKGSRGETVVVIANKIVAHISKYIRTLALISAATGLCVWGVLSLIGVDFALAWGVLAFFLNFIPTIGSIIASIPPILVAIVQFYPNWMPTLLTAASLLIIQFMIGNILTPSIMGDTLDLSPVVILISLMLWGLLWGFSGALLSVPIAVMIKIICENIEPLHFMAELMRSAKHSGPKTTD